ncbi:I78 family peptidase inhibitor [Lysobacter sp. A3-1-A15]|uniref:I78 family peptidase inhibitor n=1 Tax=Novilysobacter viscosus TaxID=3098602 RepID=UPI002ED838D2
MSAPLPPRLHLPLSLLLAASVGACAPGSMTDTERTTRTAAPTPPKAATPAAPRALPPATTTDPAAAPGCDARRVDPLSGHAATPSNLDLARELSGADSVRVIGPDQPVTADYSASRLNLEVSDEQVILRAACG